jgi:dipeptidase E
MKLYLSSYRLGDHTEKLKELVGQQNAKVAVSVNACDNSDEEGRNGVMLKRELEDMRSLGFEAEELDLRDYFGENDLLEKLKDYDLVWFSGGNTFLLIKAFRQSGFDIAIEQLVKTDELVYAGYSAAFCVLSKSLHGVDLVDDPNAKADGYNDETVWEGIGLIDFYPIVHFRSNHHESELVEKEYEYVKAESIPFKTFSDGEVFLIDGSSQSKLTKV